MTRPNAAGWWVDMADWMSFPATPVQYLKRLCLINQTFGDEIRVHGLLRGPGADLRLLTSQPSVDGGSPSASTLQEALEKAGFVRVEGKSRIGAYDALVFRKGTLWLFDVRPANFKQNEQGIFPIDVIAQRRPAAKRSVTRG